MGRAKRFLWRRRLAVRFLILIVFTAIACLLLGLSNGVMVGAAITIYDLAREWGRWKKQGGGENT